MPSTLAKEFEKLLMQDGWYVVHVRQDKTRPCPVCSTSEPVPHCPRCLGLGYCVSLYPILVRSASASRLNGGAEIASPLGLYTTEGAKHFLCLPSAQPNDRDLLVTVTWSTPRHDVVAHGEVISVQEIYEVREAEGVRGEQGEICYYSLSTVNRSVDTAWLAQQFGNRPS